MSRCKHDWRVRGSRERCELYGTVFPCPVDCRHWDCRVEKGQELPDWVTYKSEENT